MAPSTTPYPHTQVVLPSIHEMFPEHLVPHTDAAHCTRTVPINAPARSQNHPYASGPPPPLHTPAPQPSFSFDVLKSNPRGASLTHIASSRPAPQRVHTRQLSRRGSSIHAHSSSGSSDGDSAEMESNSNDLDNGYSDHVDMDLDDGEEDGSRGEVKRHVCPTCGKRFNRPSSLRIHVNTHTGATPFRCPYPACGREFNVNSNMRRHFRNHSNPPGSGSSPASPTSSLSMSPISPALSSASASSPSSYSPRSPPFPVTPTSSAHPPAFSSQPHSWAENIRYSAYPSPTYKSVPTADAHVRPWRVSPATWDSTGRGY